MNVARGCKAEALNTLPFRLAGRKPKRLREGLAESAPTLISSSECGLIDCCAASYADKALRQSGESAPLRRRKPTLALKQALRGAAAEARSLTQSIQRDADACRVEKEVGEPSCSRVLRLQQDEASRIVKSDFSPDNRCKAAIDIDALIKHALRADPQDRLVQQATDRHDARTLGGVFGLGRHVEGPQLKSRRHGEAMRRVRGDP